jgi:phosphatidylinositol alpha-mannosyltransferase
LRDSDKRSALARKGKGHAQIFDWDVVAEQIFSIYEMALVGAEEITLSSENRGWNRFLSKDGDKK